MVLLEERAGGLAPKNQVVPHPSRQVNLGRQKIPWSTKFFYFAIILRFVGMTSEFFRLKMQKLLLDDGTDTLCRDLFDWMSAIGLNITFPFAMRI